MSRRARTAWRTGAFVALVFLMTGCIKLNMNLGINSDNTVSGTIEFGVQKELLDLTGHNVEDLLGSDTPFATNAPGVTVEPFDDGEFAGQQFIFEDLPIEEFNSGGVAGASGATGVTGAGDELQIERQGETFVVTGLLEVRHHHRLGIGFGVGAGKTELLRRPQAEQLVAPGIGPEPEFLVVRELLLETFLALVERGHWGPRCLRSGGCSAFRVRALVPGVGTHAALIPASRLRHHEGTQTLAPPHTWRLAYRDMMVKATEDGVIRARRGAWNKTPRRDCAHHHDRLACGVRTRRLVSSPSSRDAASCRRGHNFHTGATASRWTFTNHGTPR